MNINTTYHRVQGRCFERPSSYGAGRRRRLLQNILRIALQLCLVAVVSGGLATEPVTLPAGVPQDDPVSARYAADPAAVPAWIRSLPWSNVLSIADFQGDTDDARLTAAQAALDGKPGVVFFPAGTYKFQRHIELESGVILRGENPSDTPKATDENYTLTTIFEFPPYRPSNEGDGTPIDTAFKRIQTREARATGCGVVNIAIQRGHIYFEEDQNHQTGNNRLVFGCILRNTAAADPDVPNPKYGHKPWQRFTHRHRAAIHVFSGENLFVANNRIPKSGDDNFMVKPYCLVKVQGKEQDFRIESGRPHKMICLDDGVEFDYDNRPGIYANYFCIGGPTHHRPRPVAASEPHAFRPGLIVRDNFIYCSGRAAIAFSGDGVLCGWNVIRFPRGVLRPTTTGRCCSDGSSTNDNRAIYIRGHRWRVIGNDYEVHSNQSHAGIKINDGEGPTHEAFCNSDVLDSELADNIGNAYLCLWVVDINGLNIHGNKISARGDAITVLSRGNTIRNLRIADNEVSLGGIAVSAHEADNIIIERNRFTGSTPAVLRVDDPSWARDNINFDVVVPQSNK